ncbi:hypothetical protein EST38_g6646 [Candolleomyces aberdarensis]|uniref:Small ribosomal subunit protein mS33 n=1 Tax=Candolleomyces aberdarensis TaxID=2316362 RepID=A0A4Q2DJ41_9AGAR|nr:hypothetical protein EST38_g6646 [Candolleomyces aberdarensis]
MSASTSRLTSLLKLRSSVFQTIWNPTGIRTGAKYLRSNLRGPAMVNYYPTTINLSQIIRRNPELEMVDEDEQQRFEDVAYRRKRGKGAPKKAKTKADSRRLGKKRCGSNDWARSSLLRHAGVPSTILAPQEIIKMSSTYNTAPHEAFSFTLITRAGILEQCQVFIIIRGIMETLPLEVYSDIIQLLRPKGQRSPRHVLPIEVVISHVSTAWRRLAFSDSQSWKIVEVFSPKTLPRATAYLSRSADAAIHLRIDLWDHGSRVNLRRLNPNDHQAFISSLTDLLRSAAPRCKSILVFTAHERTAQRLSAALVDVKAPLLQRLRIVADTDERYLDDGKQEQPAILAGAESLRFVELEIPSFPPLGQLTTLCLHNCTSDWLTAQELTRILQESTQLENLSLSMAHPVFKDWPAQALVNSGQPSVTTQSLQALRISEDESPGLASRVLLLIDAPNLISLTLMVTSTALGTFFESPQASQKDHPKFPRLQYLSLESFNNMQNVKQFTEAFPSITHLRVSYLPTYFLNRFTTDMQGPGSPWPNLHTLVFEVMRETEGLKLKESVCRIVTRRRELNLPAPKVLGDADLLRVLGRSDFLNEVIKMEELSTRNYREPWWVLDHEPTMDGIGMPR